jgi:S1-C subfamily serine protease
VGLVVVDTPTGTATGTGFMVGPGGCFVTCAHVVDDARRVMFALEGSQQLRPATLLKIDSPSDLALLHVEDRNGAPDWLMLAPQSFTPELGESLGLLGYPLGGNLGINLTYSQGVINSVRRVNEIPVLQVDTGAAPGSSGGPVFRRSDGRVVGVLSSGLAQTNGMLVNFAVDIRRLWQLGWIS